MRMLVCITVILGLLSPRIINADRASSANKNGIEAFNKKEYEKSLQYFTEALVERPDTPALNFNRGTALSALKKPDEAVNELLSAASKLKDGKESAAAYFNAGNTLFASNKIEEAIQDYKEAIKLDPSSKDIRHNLELAVRKLNQQKKDQGKDNQQKNENDQGEEKNKQKEQEQKEKEKQENKSKEQTNQTRSPQEGEKKNQQQPSQQQNNEVLPMTPEEAKRLLDAINDDEKRALSQRFTQMKAGVRMGDDW